jgi:outer membrane protein
VYKVRQSGWLLIDKHRGYMQFFQIFLFNKPTHLIIPQNSQVFTFPISLQPETCLTMKMKIALFLGLLLITNVSFAELKIGFVNIPAVLEKAPQAEKAKKRLEQEFSPRDKQLVAQQKEIQSMDDKMAKDTAVMAASARSNMEKDILNKKRDAKRAQQEFSEDFNVRRNEELGKLQSRIVEVIRGIAKDQNFDLLLTDGVIYASEQIDVTAQVQQKLSAMPN